MSEATRDAVEALTPVIAHAAQRAVERSPALDLSDASTITRDVSEKIAAVVVNQANAEPWYQSRVTWGAILTAAAGIAGIFGYAFPAEMQGKVLEAIIAAGPLIGAVVVWYGRWIAKKPLGG